jgi:hypothetical protein
LADPQFRNAGFFDRMPFPTYVFNGAVNLPARPIGRFTSMDAGVPSRVEAGYEDSKLFDSARHKRVNLMMIRTNLCIVVSATAFLLSSGSVPREVHSEEILLAQGKGKGRGGPPPWAGRGRGHSNWGGSHWGRAQDRDWDRFFDRQRGRGGPPPWAGRGTGPPDWMRGRGVWDGHRWRDRGSLLNWIGHRNDFGRFPYGHQSFGYGHRPLDYGPRPFDLGRRMFDHGFGHYQPIYHPYSGW